MSDSSVLDEMSKTIFSHDVRFIISALESLTEYAVIAIQLDGKIAFWSESAISLYGYLYQEVEKEQDYGFLHKAEGGQSDKFGELLNVAFTNKTGKAKGVVEQIRKNGEVFLVSVSVMLYRDSTGEPLGYVVIARDVTPRSGEMSNDKAGFLIHLSHELKAPLDGIIGFAEFIYAGKAGQMSPMQKECLADMLTSAHQISQLINDTTDLARLESGQLEFRYETVNVDLIVGKIRDVLYPLATKKRIKVGIKVDASLDGLKHDSARLSQVIFNYLSYMLELSPNGGQINVNIYRGEEGVCIEVQGANVILEEGDPFFVSPQDKNVLNIWKNYQGAHLGLLLTKKIVELQAGRVGVKHSHKKGSTCFAIFPLKA